MTPAGGADDIELMRLTDDQRAADAVAARRREHWLGRQAEEEGTFAGMLRDLGEREDLVAVSTVGGRTVRGVIRTIGTDYVGLRAPNGERVLVSMDAMTAVRAEPGTGATVGDRLSSVGSSLVVALGELAGGRHWISLHTTAGEGAAGYVRSVGRDVVTLEGDVSSLTYIPVARVSDVIVP